MNISRFSMRGGLPHKSLDTGAPPTEYQKSQTEWLVGQVADEAYHITREHKSGSYLDVSDEIVTELDFDPAHLPTKKDPLRGVQAYVKDDSAGESVCFERRGAVEKFEARFPPSYMGSHPGQFAVERNLRNGTMTILES